MKPGILLTDAHARSAVATCECLGRHGFRVGAATSDPPAPGQWSRRVSARLSVTNPRQDPRRFALEVAEKASAGSFAAILPGSDASVLALSNNRDVFDERIHLGLPSREAVDRSVNKVTMLDHAAAAGLASPQSSPCDDHDEAVSIAARLGYPVLLKPRQTVFDDRDGLKQRQTFIAADEEELRGALPEFGLPCLLQRFEPGNVVSLAGVATDERLLAVTFSRYLRTWPPIAGPVSASLTEAPPGGLVERVGDLVRRLGWRGIFELELIARADGSFATIDFNPRLYGSIALAAKAGAPIPAIWCDWLLHGREAECHAKPGVHYRWEEAEVRNLLLRLRSGRLAAAATLVRPRHPLARAYLRWSDPAPAAAMALRMFRSRLADRRSARTKRSASAERCHAEP